jgi:hypothetical protein
MTLDHNNLLRKTAVGYSGKLVISSDFSLLKLGLVHEGALARTGRICDRLSVLRRSDGEGGFNERMNMDLTITNFSDEKIDFTIDADPDDPSLFIRSGTHNATIRQFCTWAQLEMLYTTIGWALKQRLQDKEVEA